MTIRDEFEKYWTSLKGRDHEAYKESVFLHFQEWREFTSTLPSTEELKAQQEVQVAGRDSLAQEIHGVLKPRGYWAPKLERKFYSDLIGAVGAALDSKKPTLDPAKELALVIWSALKIKGFPAPVIEQVTEDNIITHLGKALDTVKEDKEDIQSLVNECETLRACFHGDMPIREKDAKEFLSALSKVQSKEWL
jgi:hypothetical protein